MLTVLCILLGGRMVIHQEERDSDWRNSEGNEDALPRSHTITLASSGIGRIIMLASVLVPSVMERAVCSWIDHTHLHTHTHTHTRKYPHCLSKVFTPFNPFYILSDCNHKFLCIFDSI
ncbi:hypothetical protein ATANTOWER_011188 [Ataeniobius toweri]|uniref:Secreted protein n=1 Tax=Ataeniobius toweri TaxID=208326 RepID=A0ABU7AQV8_9TELE|nr:hypothetical protein [Ataeniobius toweri]